MVTAYEHRGNAYKAAGKYDLAIADLTKAIELGLNFGKVQEALNDALKKKEAQDNGEEIIETEEIKVPEKAHFRFNNKVHFGKNGFEIKDFFEDESIDDYRDYRIAADIKKRTKKY